MASGASSSIAELDGVNLPSHTQFYEEPDISDESVSKKRKRSNDTNKARRKKAKQEKTAAITTGHGLVQEHGDIDEKNQINRTVSRMNGTLFADYMARAVKRFEPNLSFIEAEDLRVPQSAFAESTAWPGLRVCENLPDFLESTTGKKRTELAQACVQTGAPHTLVLCSAAIRAANVTRAMRCYQSKSATVAKLFAKHIKLKDAISFAKTTRMSIGIGNAQRVKDLLDSGALKLDALQHVVIDGSWSGPKKRTLFEMAEAALPTVRLLTMEAVRKRYHRDNLAILVF